MTVRELKEALNTVDNNKEVVIEVAEVVGCRRFPSLFIMDDKDKVCIGTLPRKEHK